MNEDMSQFLGVFLDEATEQLELLEQAILRLEHEFSTELVQEIFRAAHTLKGSSRAMGFTAMGELTHAMEDVFDQLRQDTLSVSSELIDALFAGLDALKEMKDEIAAAGSTTVDTTHQTSRLRAVLGGMSVKPAHEIEAVVAVTSAVDAVPTGEATLPEFLSNSQLDAVYAAVSAGCDIFALTVRVSPDCIMKSVRSFMALQALEHVGTLIATSPDEEALENEQFENDFQVIVATQNGKDALIEATDRVTEITTVSVQALSCRNAPSEVPSGFASPATEADALPVIDERMVDVGPEARGKPEEEVHKLAAEKKVTTQAQTVRVDVARLDKLLNLVGELVIDRTRIAQLCTKFEQQYGQHDLVENLNETSAHIGRITDELQEEIMKARMLPIDNVFNRFPRMMRDLAQKLGKDLNFVIEGKETELDRSVIEVIGDPLIHMLRNSIDHGIEMPEERTKAGKDIVGTVWLRARHQENHIVIEIQDDGKGMDPAKLRASAVKKGVLTQDAANRLTDKEAIKLIFAPGFSTAAIISDVSGRGVGMDIVQSNLQRLGATVDISSQPGIGSTFTVKLPLTLAIIRGLLITVSNCVYAVPLVSVVETLKIPQESIHVVNRREVILQRGKTLPIVRLRDIYHEAVTPAERNLLRGQGTATSGQTMQGSPEPTPQSLYLVVVGLADKQVGIVVDSLIGEQEVVIKSLGKFIGDIKGISGATILGDGRVALIVDVNGISQLALAEKGRAYAA